MTSAADGVLTCPNCRAALSPHALAADKEDLCPGCGKSLRGQVFPAWSTPELRPGTISDRALEGEAVCFFHPSNRAALPCDSCGRFMCAVCDLPIGARHLCPVCLGKALGKEKLPEIIARRFLWSFAAFWLGLLPLIGVMLDWPLLPITGVATIVVALVGWNRPGSFVRGPQHWAAVLGLLLGLAQLGVAYGIFSLISATRAR